MRASSTTGLSLEGEFYWRKLDHFQGPGTGVVPNQYDRGFQLQASLMVVPTGPSGLCGGLENRRWHYGEPWDIRVGVNWFPCQESRVPLEYPGHVPGQVTGRLHLADLQRRQQRVSSSTRTSSWRCETKQPQSGSSSEHPMTVRSRDLVARRQLLAAIVLAAPACAARSAADRRRRPDYLFDDSHFHLTNYVQNGTDIHRYMEIMGDKVGRSTLFGIPLQQQWSYGNSADYAPDLLPADGRPALLLLLHRRLHCPRLPVAERNGRRRGWTR